MTAKRAPEDREEATRLQRVEWRKRIKEMVADAPPIPPEAMETISRIFNNPPPDSSLMRWAVTLSCGHVVESICHDSYTDPNRSCWYGWRDCPECRLERKVISFEQLGLKAQPPGYGKPAPVKPTPARAAAIDRRVAKLRAEIAALESEREAT